MLILLPIAMEGVHWHVKHIRVESLVLVWKWEQNDERHILASGDLSIYAIVKLQCRPSRVYTTYEAISSCAMSWRWRRGCNCVNDTLNRASTKLSKSGKSGIDANKLGCVLHMVIQKFCKIWTKSLRTYCTRKMTVSCIMHSQFWVAWCRFPVLLGHCVLCDNDSGGIAETRESRVAQGPGHTGDIQTAVHHHKTASRHLSCHHSTHIQSMSSTVM